MNFGRGQVSRRRQRADIQALRAFAVGMVVINHLWPGDLPGGYIGVDIFFVLSGFLITTHLRKEADLTGKLKLARFWSQRAKRLLPAAILVLIVSAVITASLIPVTAQQAAYRQIGAAGGYFLNWLLVAESANYFAHGALSPVTHYWSLSVEEQFYILWPLLIVAALLITKSRSAATRDRVLIATFAAVFVLSLASASWSSALSPASAYFETTGRAWEFAAGGLLATLPTSRRLPHAAAGVASWLLWVGLGACAFAFSPTSGVPGPATLLPVLMTVGLLAIGDHGARWAPQSVFASGSIQWVGDLSYSIYLWHWPLIVGATFALGNLTAGSKIAIIIATFALSWLTKRYVEDAVRFSRLPLLRRPAVVLGATVATVALLLGGTAAASATIDNRAQSASNRLHELSRNPTPCFGAQARFDAGCDAGHTVADPDYLLNSWESQNYTVGSGTWCQRSRGQTDFSSCSFGVPAGEQRLNVALVGDSHASMWAPALDAIAHEYELRVTTFLALGCAALDDRNIGIAFNSDPANIEACHELRAATIEAVADSPDIDVVVTTSADQAYSTLTGGTEMDSGAGYVRAWTKWLDSGKRVIVINDVPQFPMNVPECIALAKSRQDPCAIPADSVTKNGPLASAAARIGRPDFYFVDHWGVFCGDERCNPVIGGIPAYIDQDHLTWAFTRSFGTHVLPSVALASKSDG